ncbi:MAG: hypothetical protein ACOC93_05085 [Planctomycetota bacterium]
MKRAWVLLLAGCLLMGPASVDAGVILHDQFDGDLSQWDDLSQAVPWASTESAFEIRDSAVTLTDFAKAHTGWSFGEDLVTYTALDFQFPEPIQRGPETVITTTFRAKWSGGAAHGEGSRLVATYTHDYPAGGLDLTRGERWTDKQFNDGAAWARPAYNMRIRLGGDESMLMYGGGHAPEGEFEMDGSRTHWLAGFSSGPGGHSPQPGTPGVVGAGAGIWSTSEFEEYRYVLTPTHQQLWYDGGLVGSQDISETFDSGGFRTDFSQIEGIRLFWRGAAESQAVIDSVTVTVVPEPTSAALLVLGGLATLRPSRRRHRGSAR